LTVSAATAVPASADEATISKAPVRRLPFPTADLLDFIIHLDG
jgi:hypothetical protein